MIFHAIDPATGAAADPAQAPAVMFLAPEFCDWWAMAPLAAQLPQGHVAVLATWDGLGECGDKTFSAVVDEAKAVVAWTEKHVPSGLAALVGCGLGGQVAIEALCGSRGCAQRLFVADVLCEPVPGAAASARLNGWSWGLMGGPKQVSRGLIGQVESNSGQGAKLLATIRKRRRYLASSMDGFGIPRGYIDSFARTVATTSRDNVAAMSRAVEEWRIPQDIGCISAPAVVATCTLTSAPYRTSGQALVRAIGGAQALACHDLSRNELCLRFPARAMESIAGLLAQPSRP